jgi:rare lipoprotein A
VAAPGAKRESATTDAVARRQGAERARAGAATATTAVLAVALAAAPLLSSGCATAPSSGGATAAPLAATTTLPPGRPGRPIGDGRASYYSQIFAGRRTASGERYDPERMTAAHKTLPFGTWVRVTRPDGRWVEVRITDRCGCGGGHIIDLSRAAARRLDMLREGSVAVRLEIIEK